MKSPFRNFFHPSLAAVLLAVFALGALSSFSPVANGQNLTGAMSRKLHGPSITPYDLPIDKSAIISGAVTFESRQIGNGHVIVFVFDTAITQAGTPAAVDAVAAPIGTASAQVNPGNTSEVIVTLTGVPDDQRVTVSLDNVNGNVNHFVASLGFRVGDSDNSGTLTLSDVNRVKARSAAAVSSGNFVYDLNTTGLVTAADIAAVKRRSKLFNGAPSVNAGGNQVIALPATATLAGVATDDGLPEPPALTTGWSRVSGPFTVTFGNAASLNTTATFAGPGTFVLRLTASDGLLSSASDVTITVDPGPAVNMAVTGFTSPVAAGTAGTATVTVRDAMGNIATGYRGTVHFTSSDASATLPANYTFIAGDNGVHLFSIALATVGTQSITATDVAAPALNGTQSAITVNSAVLPGLFEKANPWNKDVSALLPSSRSAAIISALVSMGGWGNGNVLQIDRSIAILYADSTTPRGTINAASGYYLPDGDSTPLQMPLPLNGNTEGNVGYTCDRSNDDCHVLVVERTQKKLYELYNATGTSSSMIALGAFVWDLTKAYPDVLRGEQCTSADAAGLPMAALIPTSDEVAAGEVPHALRFILPNPRMKARFYVHPATHAGGPSSGNANAPPYGVRFRLQAGFDETLYPVNARVIIRAMKKYGMILSDGGNIALTFADDRLSTAKWAALGITNQTFNNIPVTAFDVVDLGTEIVNTFNCVRAP
ncbi:MAG: hypothetical protein ABI905_14035 [Betaproteobacteria bacterium]